MTLPLFKQANDGGTCVLPQPGQFELELKETPATGYRWHLDFSTGLTLMSSDLALEDGAPPGAGGVRRWVFQADDAGDFLIQGKLWREWLGDDSIVAHYRLSVRVA